MPNHYDKLKESASPTERGRQAKLAAIKRQTENKKNETDAKNKVKVARGKATLQKSIEAGKKRHAKRQKDANKKPSSNLPPWIERKVQREVESFKTMYDAKKRDCGIKIKRQEN